MSGRLDEASRVRLLHHSAAALYFLGAPLFDGVICPFRRTAPIRPPMSASDPSSTPSLVSRWPRSMRALAHRNFRFYFLGHAVSILGSWIQQVALSWLVYRLTGSAALLGVTAFCALIPQLLIGPLAGAWIDKQDKKKWLIGVQSLLAVQAFGMAALTVLDWVGTPLIVSMSLMLGVLNSFDTPLRQSLINSFVGRLEDLPNALALNAMLFNASRFVGPPLAGLLLGISSESACFAINGLSFVALIVGLVRIRSTPPARAKGSMGEVFREGVGYLWHTWPVRMLIVTLAVVNLTASAYAVLLPIFARDIFGGDARTLGMIWGAAGCGAFVATILLAHTRQVRALVTTVVGGAAASAVSLIVFALAGSLPLAMLAMAGVGFGISISNVAINMLLQSMAPERLRGRVVSFFSSTRFGFDALGGLIAGFLAAGLGAGRTLLIEGVVLAAFLGVVLSRRRRLFDDVTALHP
ncbi:MFS transporter [Zoogloea sp.]|uniref:MFS transporter n=1 Tax=Zoogloea sp. TaxID=49181 RepID=UPI0035B2F111